MDQGSPEWFAIRCGKVTASKVADVMAKTRSGWGASRANYMGQLIAERLTGKVQESYTNAAMQWGIDNEGFARSAYEFYSESEVEEIGFVIHPVIEMSGASPDGLVGEHGLVEIKCPNTSTHIETLLSKKIPGKYETQMLWQMACTGRQWCDFVSFDPRMPEDMRMFVKRLEINHKAVAEMEQAVSDFISELEFKIEQLKAAA